MKKSKLIIALSIIAVFLFAITFTVSAQDGTKKKSPKEETEVATKKKSETSSESETDDLEDHDDDNDETFAEQDDDRRLKKYKKKKAKKVKKEKKEFKGKGHAYGRDKDEHGREFGKKRSEEAKSKKHKSDDDRAETMTEKKKEEMAETKGKPQIKAVPEVAPAGPAKKSTQEQVRDLESRIGKMENILKTKELSDDAKRKYTERITEYQKELDELKAKQERIKGPEID